jgi:CHAD domain-containing protein
VLSARHGLPRAVTSAKLQVLTLGDAAELLANNVRQAAESLAVELERRASKLRTKHVHTLRLSLRRLLSALELAVAVGCKIHPRLRRDLEKLLGGTSALRDVQVQRHELKQAISRHPKAGERRLSTSLQHRRRDLVREARKLIERFELGVFEHEIRGVLASLESIAAGPASDAAVRAAVLGQLARLHLAVEARRRSVLHARDQARALHRLRLALKKYRYSLEVAAPALPEHARALASTAASLQELIGKARDAQLFASMVRAELGRHRDRPTSNALYHELERDQALAQLAATKAVCEAQFDWPFA